MFPTRFFAPTYFAPLYFPAVGGAPPAADGVMFAPRYFAARYFAPRYFPGEWTEVELIGSATGCLIAYENLADTVAIETNSEVTTLPAVNLQDTSIQVPWRSTAMSCYLALDFGAPMEIGVVALAGLNLAATDTIRLRLSAVAPGDSELYDTGVVASGVLPGYGTWMASLITPVQARWVRIDIAVEGPLQYVQAGRLWAGPYLSLRHRHDYGSEDGFIDRSQVRSAPRSGRTFVDRGARQRSMSFVLSNLLTAEGRATVKDMLAAIGNSEQALVCLDPGNSDYVPRETYIGRLEDLRPITHRTFDTRGLALRIAEDL
jgi:hypothetical protein